MALIQKADLPIKITQYLRSSTLQQLESKLINFIYWCPLQCLCINFKELSKVFMYYLSHLASAINYYSMVRYLINLMEQKKMKAPKMYAHQLSYLMQKIKWYTKNTKLSNNLQFNHHQIHQLKFIISSQLQQRYNILTQECRYQQDQPNKTIDLMNKIMVGKINLPNPSCIGCSQFYYGYRLPEKNQLYTVVGFNYASIFLQNLRRHICGVLNNGGGYVFINDDFTAILRGIQMNQQVKNYIYQNVEQCLKSIQPSNQLLNFRIQFLQLTQDPFQILNAPQIDSSSATKFVVRIILVLKKFKAFYVEHVLKANKVVQSFYIKKKGEIVRVVQHNIYKLMLKFHQINTHKFVRKKIICPKCLISTQKIGQIIEQIETFTEKNPDLPIFKYKYTSVLAISSLKYEEDFIKNFQIEVKKKNHYVCLSKPYTKFCVNALREFWVISHACDFEQLSRMIRAADIQIKTRLVSVTKFIQVKGSQKEDKLKRMQLAYKQYFKQQLYRQSRFQKQEKYSSKEVLFTYLQFTNLQQSIFAYVNLDNMSVRCEFIKQHHMKNQHKKKN